MLLFWMWYKEYKHVNKEEVLMMQQETNGFKNQAFDWFESYLTIREQLTLWYQICLMKVSIACLKVLF